MNAAADELLRFISASPTPFHAVATAASMLTAAGFAPLAEEDAWDSLKPGRYFVNHDHTCLFAFVLPEGGEGFRIVGAHTDSPNLRLKPHPQYSKEGYAQLGVEVYGGVLLNSWLDRDLSIAGRVLIKQNGKIASQLVRLDGPLCRVPQLAIHLDRDVNERGVALNRQEHLAPILALGDHDLFTLVAKECGVTAKEVVGTELMLFDSLAPARGGANGEFIFSARLDNLAMSLAAVRSLIASADRALKGGAIAVAALFDHEEVGSDSVTGAASGFLPRALSRLARRFAQSDDEAHRIFARSLCVSADMAHAVHPNYPEKHEARHKPRLNAGPVIKINSQQRYATTATTRYLFKQLAEEANVPVQEYVNRTDLPCGSTIGPIASTLLGVRTVDVGNPMLSMHSCREMAGAEDPAMMEKVLALFYTCADPEGA